MIVMPLQFPLWSPDRCKLSWESQSRLPENEPQDGFYWSGAWPVHWNLHPTIPVRSQPQKTLGHMIVLHRNAPLCRCTRGSLPYRYCRRQKWGLWLFSGGLSQSHWRWSYLCTVDPMPTCLGTLRQGAMGWLGSLLDCKRRIPCMPMP